MNGLLAAAPQLLAKGGVAEKTGRTDTLYHPEDWDTNTKTRVMLTTDKQVKALPPTRFTFPVEHSK